ncbi:MAG: hypothetical protein FJ184_12475 [Gammaproteobacteria bacterium]|nr:hypothetical protein [Gammaproteobacteria bacterium]
MSVVTEIGSFIQDYAKQPRFFGVVFTVALLIAIVDFFSRVLIFRGAERWAFESPAKVSFPESPTPETVDRLLQAWFPPPKPAEVAPAFREVQLEAVFKTPTVQRAAMLILGSSPAQPAERRLVSVGEIIEGWTVSSISLGIVVLHRDGATKEMKLFPAR